MTFEEKQKIYAALAAPFPEEAIERTDGRVTGRGYSTTGIKYQYVANRLNEVLGIGGWRAHRTVTVKPVLTAHGREAFEAICDITLELGEWIGGDFVVFAESLADGGHTATSEADARKGAYTNAFKKAAAFFGCGRQAYEGSIDDDSIPAEPAAAPTAATPPEAKPAPAESAVSGTSSKPSAPQRSRLSSKQLSAIWAISRKLGYEQASLRAYVKHACGVQPEFLTRQQASDLIGSLNARSANGHAREPEHNQEA